MIIDKAGGLNLSQLAAALTASPSATSRSASGCSLLTC
jgi:hypothetical protein